MFKCAETGNLVWSPSSSLNHPSRRPRRYVANKSRTILFYLQMNPLDFFHILQQRIPLKGVSSGNLKGGVRISISAKHKCLKSKFVFSLKLFVMFAYYNWRRKLFL